VHIYIPLWLCWTGGLIAVVVVGMVVGGVVAAGLGEDDRDLEGMLSEPYPDPRHSQPAQPRQHQL
jgi:hypothetical protein